MTLLEVTRGGEEEEEDVSVSVQQADNSTLAALADRWPRLWGLLITCEQRQHLQTIDIRAGQGMADTGQWCTVPTL